MGLDGELMWQEDRRGAGFDIDVIDVEEIRDRFTRRHCG